MNSRITAIDIFGGAGGLTCGLKMAGFQVLATVEKECIPADTYKLNHPEVKLFQNDIRKLNPKLVREALGLKLGQIGLLAACPPCQGFSRIRTNNKSLSINDERNDLVYEVLKWVKVFMPACVLIENVPSLAKDMRISKIRRELSNLGYKICEDAIRIEDVAEYGVPQRRLRMILLASRLGSIQKIRKSRRRNTVRDAIFGMKKAGSSGDSLHDFKEVRSREVMKIINLIPRDGGSRRDLPRRYWLKCHLRDDGGFSDVYGRMTWDEVAPTITGGCTNPSKGRFIHPEENRAITLREAALLQTFPMQYKFSLSGGKEHVARMIGNALPPEFIRRQAISIRRHLEKYISTRK